MSIQDVPVQVEAALRDHSEVERGTPERAQGMRHASANDALGRVPREALEGLAFVAHHVRRAVRAPLDACARGHHPQHMFVAAPNGTYQ